MLAANERLRAWRIATYDTQGDAARALEMAQGALSEIESGKRLPTLPQAIRIEDASEGTLPVRIWTKSKRRVRRAA